MDSLLGYILYIYIICSVYMFIYIYIYHSSERLLNLQLEPSNIRSCIAPVPLCTEVMKLKLPALQSTLAQSTDLPLHVNQ
jgi:hypothetical protein